MRQWVEVTGLTVGEVTRLRMEHAIPDEATFEYAGCGSHELGLEWDDGEPEPPPPPPTPEEIAQDLDDQRMGF